MELNLKLNNKKLDEAHWEVTLEISAKVTSKEDEPKVMFIMEIEHGAVFMLKNIPEEHLAMVLGVDCPTLLFPVHQAAGQPDFGGWRLYAVSDGADQFHGAVSECQEAEGAGNIKLTAMPFRGCSKQKGRSPGNGERPFPFGSTGRLIQSVGDEVIDQAGDALLDSVVEQGVILSVGKYRFR